jgi:hypothetical protein
MRTLENVTAPAERTVRMRRLLRDIGEGRELGDVTTLRDANLMAALAKKVAERKNADDHD